MTNTNTLLTENIGATWKLFKHDPGVLEVRALLKSPGENKQVWEGWGEIISGYFDDYGAFADCVMGLDRSKLVKGVYVTMNPVLPALLGRAQNRLIAAGKRSPTTSDDDIVSRMALLIDADPFRPAEIASTQAEMEAAIAKRDEVAAWLYSQGFPAMHSANSGNGAHLLGRIDRPNDNDAKQLVNDFLECLNWKFGTVPADNKEAKRQFAQGVVNVGIDTTVFNASRITKLYGTAVRKGDDTDDRPHRRAQLTFIPGQSEIIPAELLERVAQEYRDHKAEQERKKQPHQTTRNTFSTNGHKPAADWAATVDGVEQWFRDHGVTLGSRDTYTSNGFQYKWDLVCILNSDHKDGACLMWGANKGLGYKCHHNGCKGMGWADVRNLIAPKTYTNGHSSNAAKRTVDADTGEILDDAPAATLDDVLRAIGAIAGNADLKPIDRQKQIVRGLSSAIGDIDKSLHVEVVAALEVANAGFTQTGAKGFVRAAVADAKKRNKAAERVRKEAARQNLLAVRAKKGKASIDTGNRQLSDIVDEALQVLVSSNADNPTVFVRGGALVRIVQDERGYYGIQELTAGALLGKLADIADWETVGLDDNGNPQSRAVFPPRDVVNTILSAGAWPGLPALSGIVNAPVFSRDGVLHDQPGYNKATRLYYTGGVKVGDTTPTPENLAHAKDLILNNLLVDFPFKDAASLAHALVYLLLPFVRDMIDGPTPVHDVDSPTPGTGKGKLLNACAYPFLGHDVPTQPAVEDDGEWRKIVTTRLLSGDTHLVIDNVNHELNSGALASAFTQPVWTDRTLGANREVKIPIRTIWAITANNIKMSQELTRRCIWIRLDANSEKPHERTGFKHPNLMTWAKQNRDALVTAALTFVRAWVDRGMPLYTGRVKGSYEEWAGVMGGILEAVGIPGFLENEAELFSRVIVKNDQMADFINGWWDEYGSKETSQHDLFKLASRPDLDADNVLGGWHDLLGDMLSAQKQRGRQTQLGNILQARRDTVVAGYKITWAKFQRGVNFWRLEAVDSGEPQKSGEPQNQGSPLSSQVVDDKKTQKVVNLGEPLPPTTRLGEIFYSCLENDTTQQDGQEKINPLCAQQAVEVHQGSPLFDKSEASQVVEAVVNLVKSGEPRFKVHHGKTENAILESASFRCQSCETSKWSVPLKVVMVAGGYNVLCEKCHKQAQAVTA